MKTSVQYKLLYGLFKAIGVNKMLDSQRGLNEKFQVPRLCCGKAQG